MRYVCLLGRGVGHSFSPAMWNRVFDRLGVDLRYGLCDVEEDELPRALEELDAAEVWAYNVTMPYKPWAREVATRTTREVDRSGVANFLSTREGQRVAANTDIEGARALLAERPEPDLTLLLGAGATGRALLTALGGRSERVVICNRTHQRALDLADTAATWGPDISVVEWSDRAAAATGADLIVNTTPFGQSVEGSPLPEPDFRDDAAVYDVIYGEQPTPLQRQAAAAGLATSDGLAHLQEQAVALLPHFGLDRDHAPLVRESLREVVGRDPIRWEVPPTDAATATP